MSRRINVMLCQVGREPVVSSIGNDLPDLQHAVGGDIQDVPLLQLPGLSVVCNTDGEGRLPKNRDLPGVYGTVHGDFLIARTDGPEYVSLTANDLAAVYTYLRGGLAYFRK